MKNTVGNSKITHRFILKRNNIASKHTTNIIFRNNVANIIDNRNESKIKRKTSSNYKLHDNAVTRDIAQLQRKRESSHIFLPVNKNIVNIDINKHEVEKNHKHNASMYTINTVASDDNDNDIIERAIKTNNTSHNTQYSHSMF